MPAYFVIELDIQDFAGFDEYARAVFGLLPKYGVSSCTNLFAPSLSSEENREHPQLCTTTASQGSRGAGVCE
jgi:hypothetical protein